MGISTAILLRSVTGAFFLRAKRVEPAELHLVINPTSADHNLVTQVHQFEVGEDAQPLVLTPPGVFLAAAEGRLTAASFSLTTDQRR